MKTNRHKSTDYKYSAVQYYINNGDTSLRKTCDIFKCSKYSLARWIKRFIQTNSVENKLRKTGSYKIKHKHVDFILDLIKQKPTITLLDILSNFYKKFNDITLSKTHLSNIIRFANITYKQIQHTHKPIKRYNKIINYNDEYNKFYTKVNKYNLKNIISIDETSINVGIGLKNGRNEIGKRLYKITKNNIVFVKYTLIMAISTNIVIGWILYKKGGMNHVRLINFLSNVIDRKKNKLILLDNASCHRSPTVKKFIKDSKNDYVYIIPYHHFQNPIEKFFNQLKCYIKKDEPMNYNEIRDSIKRAIKRITNKNLMNYFISSLRKNSNEINKIKMKYHKKPKNYK